MNTVGGVDRYDYDLNGNVTIRNKGLSSQQTLTWNVENQLVGVAATGLSESYYYNEHGIRVRKVSNGATTLYPFAHYEVDNGVIVKYYFFGGQRVAMKRGTGAITYLHQDHLSSTALSTTSSGAFDVGQGYRGYGNYRTGGSLPTVHEVGAKRQHRYTGQKLPPNFGGIHGRCMIGRANRHCACAPHAPNDPFLRQATAPDSPVTIRAIRPPISADSAPRQTRGKPMIHFGVDTLLRNHTPTLAGKRIGLVTNDAATTAALPHPLTPTRLALQQAGVNLVALFAPEHGLGAAAADGAEVADATDPLTGLPVLSLYGATFEPTAEMLAGLDLLLFDIPDIGVRFYTYIWTLSYVLEACARHHLPLWVLDRPNPLGGDLAQAEGPLLDEAQLASFVGRWAIPIRHSLTPGELARLWNAERNLGAALTVIPVAGWEQRQPWPALGLPFVPASPSMPSDETVVLYPGMCLFEGTNLSEGRGTTTPFRVAGAPWLDAHGAVAAFNALALPGVVGRAVQFTPTASKYAHEACHAVMLHVLDAAHFRPVATGLHLLRLILHRHPEAFAWLPYPTAAAGAGFGHFDRLIGDRTVREALAGLGNDAHARIAAWTATPGWAARVRPHLLYGGS